LTLAELIARVESQFSAAPLFYGHGTDNAHDEAAWLVLRALGLPFNADLRNAATDVERIERLAERRISERMPVAYLLKEAWLAGQPFYVDERVIVPRSHIAELLPSLGRRSVRRVLDLCTGSGCLAVLAARIFRAAEVDALDLSPGALAVARKNVARHRVGRRVHLHRSDLFDALPKQRYDLIVTNPPYVAASSMGQLPPEYRHEPRLALAGGPDGLDLVARILAQAPDHLEADGLLVCEVGDAKAAVQRRFRSLRLDWLKPEVFAVQRDALPHAASKGASGRRQPTPSKAKR
jgi:ribosomal protein L3 glutamine methyltransferase